MFQNKQTLSRIAAFALCSFATFASPARADDWDDCMARDLNKIAVGCSAIITQNSRSPEDMTRAYIARAGSYYRQQMIEQALADLDQALALSPQSVNALIGRGDERPVSPRTAVFLVTGSSWMTSSTMLLNDPHCGHLPIYEAETRPQAWQT